MKHSKRAALALLAIGTLVSGCVVPAPDSRPWLLEQTPLPATPTLAPSLQDLLPTPRPPGAPYFTPTPDAVHSFPALRADVVQYVVQNGDYMSLIAARYQLPLAILIQANPLVNPEALVAGQVLVIPAPQPLASVSDFKIIPDSELVYGPASATLQITPYIDQFNAALSHASEEVNGEILSGAQIVDRICRLYSVNPRLMLALIEYQSAWLTNPVPDATYRAFPMGRFETSRSGLYQQLEWAADTLNHAFYLYQINALPYAMLKDNNLVMHSFTINPGTAAVQYLLAQLYDLNGYRKAISPEGFFATYTKLFGQPFDLAVNALLPEDLSQPELQLPFEEGVAWSFTGGPHGGWGLGSAWAALDFAPPGDAYGCVKSDAWVVAAADGVVVRSEDGAVVLDLDGDGYEQTGWTLLYGHIETRDRVAVGTVMKKGERIGHPSCEGGYSNGTHVHFARRYNGVWISADTTLPFNLEGWISTGDGVEYDGTLTRNGVMVTAWDGRIDENQIQR